MKIEIYKNQRSSHRTRTVILILVACTLPTLKIFRIGANANVVRSYIHVSPNRCLRIIPKVLSSNSISGIYPIGRLVPIYAQL